MKVIIAGSRSCTDPAVLRAALACVNWPITTVICGKAPGADTLGELWAREAGLPVMEFPAMWWRYGSRRAGPLRNVQMLQHADAVLALWDGKSSGTAHMVRIAQDARVPVYVHRF